VAKAAGREGEESEQQKKEEETAVHGNSEPLRRESIEGKGSRLKPLVVESARERGEGPAHKRDVRDRGGAPAISQGSEGLGMGLEKTR